MRIMLDTNVIISAIVFGGQTGTLLKWLLQSDHELFVSEYVDSEFKAKLQQKWPSRADRAYSMIHQLRIHFVDSTSEVLGPLRDSKDVPVLSDARFHHVDVLLTGDKDFLEAEMDSPIILSPAMMMEYLGLK